MKTNQTSETLARIFEEEKKRIVFWYDADKEFEEELASIAVDGVTLLRIDEHGALDLKIRLEVQDPKGKYILYAPYAEPAPEVDWLFDIRLYSYFFQADQTSIHMRELNLDRQSLRPHLKKRRAFLKNKERLNRLKKWIQTDDREDDIDMKMLAVIIKADQPHPFQILMRLLAAYCQKSQYLVDEPPQVWSQIKKMGLIDAFWKMVAMTFGYIPSDNPSINDFLIRLFVTDLSVGLKSELPASLSHFAIENRTNIDNCAVFLSQWRTHTEYFRYYNFIAAHFANKLKIDEVLFAVAFESLLNVMTFETVERRIVSALKDRVGHDLDADYEPIKEIISQRLDGYWATTTLGEDQKYNLYRLAYKAIGDAIRLFELRKQYDTGFSYPSAKKMFEAYASELFLFDQQYRTFHERADICDMAGLDVLKSLKERIESCYSGWFMGHLALTWDDFLKKDATDCLMKQWKLPSVINQHDFFRRHIAPTIEQSDRNRMFVIISDAFRFEAAEALTRKINGKYRLRADLTPMLGVLPSYTALGMAALLPHRSLDFKDDISTALTVDEKPCGSMDQRKAILEGYSGTAVKADDLMSMNKAGGREFVKPYRVIYIYHDRIDAIGDKAVSESNTFAAVRQTLDELYALVSFIINSLNGTRVVITADHGFVYQEKAPEPIDKSTLGFDFPDAAKTHKRFIMGKNLEGPEKLISGNTKITAHTKNDMAFVLPSGTNRYNFVGGARFFHGGATLQEVVVPVITVSEMKGKHIQKSQVRQVGVSPLGSVKKLVTNRPVYKLIQTDPVSERMHPITLKVSLRDGNDLISNEETITFDSQSSSMDDRQKSVKLRLMAGTYDNKKEYALVLRNTDDTEYDRYPVMIDIAFADEF